jgi:hypothetical protein
MASAALLFGLVILSVAVFRHYGISNDEEVQHHYGELIVRYYESGLSDRTLFQYKNLYLYGGLFDIIAVLLGKVLAFDIYLVRHFLCGMIGVAGIGATAALARLVAGPRAGFFAAALLATSGIWFGAMFNHTKDVPFAVAMVGGTYFLLRIMRDMPSPRWRDMIGFGLMLGCALGLRALGLFLLVHAFVAVLFTLPWHAPRRMLALAFIRSGLRFVPAFALGYVIMIVAWPWASLHPLNPLWGLFAFTHFAYPIRTILADHVYAMADVPRWYVPAYLAIRLPILLLFGVIAALASTALPPSMLVKDTRLLRTRAVAFVAFTVLAPLGCEALVKGPAFDGLRHFTFVVPALAALAGVGLDAVLTIVAPAGRHIARVAVTLAIGLLVWNAAILVRLHPYEYVFYNAFVGGLPGAARHYVMDYWVNIMPEAVRALQTYLDQEGQSHSARPYTVGVCGERFSFEDYADRRLQWTGGWREADFFIAPTHMNCDRATDGRVVVSIERLGVPIGVVKDRRPTVEANHQR